MSPLLCPPVTDKIRIEFGAATENVIATSGYALVLLGTAMRMLLPVPGVWAGCVVVLLASIFYFTNEDRGTNNSGKETVSGSHHVLRFTS